MQEIMEETQLVSFGTLLLMVIGRYCTAIEMWPGHITVYSMGTVIVEQS